MLTAGAYFAAVAPAMQQRDAEAASRVALAEAREQVSRLASSARSIRTQLTNAQTTLARIEIPLDSAAAINARLAKLSELALQCGLDVQYTRTGAVSQAASQRFARLPIQLAGTGNYRACATFLHRLRSEFPDTGMKTFDLSTAPGDASGTISFSFELVWYVQPTAR
jgi:Tfp pilus assembly protein PilO